MLFNSISFAFFLPIIYLSYWFFCSNSKKVQNILLLLSSYFFYSCWDWRFLFLLIFSTFLDFFSAFQIAKSTNKNIKKTWLWLCISINLGFLGIFKYYNFFISSFANLISSFGLHLNPYLLKVILPVGISFYTFHGLSYIIDIYNQRIKPEKNIVDYSLFVSFFPLLVAGPIERATHLLPQIKSKRTFNYLKTVDGLKQILWGLFKKIVIADNCAEYANLAFDNSSHFPSSGLILGAIFFSFQIYCDFSGYSDIAIGSARLFGIDLLRNFAFPYFSRDFAEFWRRWHISLSSWFKDYVYIPLGGSKNGKWNQIKNTFIIFLISGFWHGANWTFIIWGFLNAIYILPSIIFNYNRYNIDIVAKGKSLPSFKDIIAISTTFALTVFAWIFFRSESVIKALEFVKGIFSQSILSFPKYAGIRTGIVLFLILIFITVEWIGRQQEYAIEQLGTKWKEPYRWALYYLIIIAIWCSLGNEQKFIYFQF